MATVKPKPKPLAPLPRVPKPDYTSKIQLPAPLDDIASGMSQLADLGKGAVQRIGERLRTIRRAIR